jgi:hypothetical protein
MSKNSNQIGFYSIATDGNSIFVSNYSKNSICKIGPDGTVDKNFIIVTRPLSIAVRTNVLFVQTLRFIHVYDISISYQATNISSLRFDSSENYPSMVYNKNDNLLYISNYDKGTITTMNSFGVFVRILTGVEGISGICIASKLLYFSNELKGNISFYTSNIINECLVITKPKGICFSPNGLYICYGTEDKFGIALYKLDSSTYTEAISTYLNRSMPLTVFFAGEYIYYTSDKRNEIYKNGERYIIIEYIDIKIPTEITQSVVTKNESCLNNPAFTGLINLRTVGSNQNNPIIPVTTLVGRTQGAQVRIDDGAGMSYDVLKMRRKAEILKYKNKESNSGSNFTKKQSLSNLVNVGGSYQYSKAKINQLIKEQNCRVGINQGIPLEKTPPTNSGVIDRNFEGYYLNTYIPYYPSL